MAAERRRRALTSSFFGAGEGDLALLARLAFAFALGFGGAGDGERDLAFALGFGGAGDGERDLAGFLAEDLRFGGAGLGLRLGLGLGLRPVSFAALARRFAFISSALAAAGAGAGAAAVNPVNTSGAGAGVGAGGEASPPPRSFDPIKHAVTAANTSFQVASPSVPGRATAVGLAGADVSGDAAGVSSSVFVTVVASGVRVTSGERFLPLPSTTSAENAAARASNSNTWGRILSLLVPGYNYNCRPRYF